MSKNETVFAFPTELLNEHILATKLPNKKKLKGFGYEKALKYPWKYSLETVLEKLKEEAYIKLQKVNFDRYKILLFAIRAKLTTGVPHWYLIVLHTTTPKNTMVVWDSLWQSNTVRDQRWDEKIIR